MNSTNFIQDNTAAAFSRDYSHHLMLLAQLTNGNNQHHAITAITSSNHQLNPIATGTATPVASHLLSNQQVHMQQQQFLNSLTKMSTKNQHNQHNIGHVSSLEQQKMVNSFLNNIWNSCASNKNSSLMQFLVASANKNGVNQTVVNFSGGGSKNGHTIQQQQELKTHLKNKGN